jgi:hypothetical protein
MVHHDTLLLVGMARSLLYRGVLDQSLDYARLAIEEGEKFGHPATLCRSLVMILPVYLALDDWQRSEQYIAQLTDLSAAHALKPYSAIATGLRGRWLLLQNNIRDGIPLLKRASEQLEAQRHEMLNMDFVCDLGAGLGASGQHEDALTWCEYPRAPEARRKIVVRARLVEGEGPHPGVQVGRGLS